MPVRRTPPRRPRLAAGLALVALTAVGISAPIAAAIKHAAPSGTDSGSCGSTTSPCRTVQRVVDNAASGDEIRLAGGTYSGLGGTCANISATAVACVINKQLTVRGGYSTADWTTSLPTLNPTFIDGENLRRGLIVERTSPAAPAASLVLEKLEIRRGYGTPRTAGGGDALTFGFGGGIDAVSSPLTLRGVVISDCRVIGSNSTGDYAGAASGGGISARNSPTQTRPLITFESVRLLRNVADAGDNTGATGRGGYAHGGGLYTYFVTVTGTDVRLEDNSALAGSATSSDGASVSGERGDGLGGAISIEFGSMVSLTDVVAAGNVALGGNASPSLSDAVAGGGFGGAIQIEGNPSQPSSLVLTASDLVQNEARGGTAFTGGLGRGGSLIMNDSPVTLDGVLLLANLSQGGDGDASGSGACGFGEAQRGTGDGGGATLTRYFSSAIAVTLRNSIVAGNQALMGTTGCEPGGGGGGLFLDGVDATLEHVTLAGNSIGPTSMQGSGMVLLATVAGAVANWSHGIVADHLQPASASAIHAQSGTSVTFDRGLFAGNADDTNSGGGSFSGLGTTITADSAAFLQPGPPSYDYRISVISPAIDAALGSTQALDFEGQPRDAPRDLGADELGSPAALFSDDFESADLLAWN